MSLLRVTMVRKGFDDRECAVRVTDDEVREALNYAGRFGAALDGLDGERWREERARQHAVRRWFGPRRTWQGAFQNFEHAHRGQVWESSRIGDGQNAVTSVITMRVEPWTR